MRERDKVDAPYDRFPAVLHDVGKGNEGKP